jgi:DNA-binding NarL/FixJ family response regulator
MMDPAKSCVLLADRHHGLMEGVRGLLEATFDSVFIVADEASLLEGAQRLAPCVVVADVAMAEGDLPAFLSRIMGRSPHSSIVVLSAHDEPGIARAALRAGARATVLKRSIVTDLLQAVEEIRAGRSYISPAMRG